MALQGVGDRYYPAGGVQGGTDALTSAFNAAALSQNIPFGYSTFGP
jgi:hypothetical protein